MFIDTMFNNEPFLKQAVQEAKPSAGIMECPYVNFFVDEYFKRPFEEC